MSISGSPQPILPNALAQVSGTTYQTICTAVNNVRGVYIGGVAVDAVASGLAYLRIGGATIIECGKSSQSGGASAYGNLDLAGWVIPAGQLVELAGSAAGAEATINYRVL